jgi:hypothetical protein
MKLSIILMLFCSQIANCQNNILKKTWINSKNYALIIRDSNLWMEGSQFSYDYDYIIQNDTIVCIDYLFTDINKYPKINNKYKIIKLNKDTLVLSRPRKESGELTSNIDTLYFVDSTKLKSNVKKFNKLLIQSSYLSSLTTRFKLEIDSSGKVVYWDKNFPKDYLSLQIDKLDIQRLNYYILNIRIENFTKNTIGQMIDQSCKYLTIDDGKNTYKCKFKNFPYITLELFEFIKNIVKATKTSVINLDKYEFLE